MPAFRRELAQFCVLCGMWIMDTKSLSTSNSTTTRYIMIANQISEAEHFNSVSLSKHSCDAEVTVAFVTQKSAHQAVTVSSAPCSSNWD